MRFSSTSTLSIVAVLSAPAVYGFRAPFFLPSTTIGRIPTNLNSAAVEVSNSGIQTATSPKKKQQKTEIIISETRKKTRRGTRGKRKNPANNPSKTGALSKDGNPQSSGKKDVNDNGKKKTRNNTKQNRKPILKNNVSNSAKKANTPQSENKKKGGQNNNRKKKNLVKKIPTSKLVVGKTYNAKVASVLPYGAYVRIENYAFKGLGALLHISQIQKENVANITEVLKVGQRLKNVRVTAVNSTDDSVSVSLLAAKPPRMSLEEVKEHCVGLTLEGKVMSIAPYGAFIDVGCKGINALLHKSRITRSSRVDDVHEFLKQGQIVNVRVTDVNVKQKSVAVSMLSEESEMYLKWRAARRTNVKDLSEKLLVSLGEKESGEDDEIEKALLMD